MRNRVLNVDKEAVTLMSLVRSLMSRMVATSKLINTLKSQNQNMKGDQSQTANWCAAVHEVTKS